MGLGLPAAVGLALAKKMKKEPGTVYVLMSDGEMQIGTTWEAAAVASHHRLTNLVVIVDNNGLQAMGKTANILDFKARKVFDAFEWKTFEVNGHNYTDIGNLLSWDGEYKDLWPPLAIIANTTKGKGVSFMENNNIWHYKAPSEEEYEEALAQLS